MEVTRRRDNCPRVSCNREFVPPLWPGNRIDMKPTTNRIVGTHPRCESAIALRTAVSPERFAYLISGVFWSMDQRGSLMLSKCANPKCVTSLDDYRQGRLFRFQQSHPEGGPSVNTHCVQHFWLCKGCSETHTLEQRKGRVILIIRGHQRFSNDRRAPSDEGCLESSQSPVLCDMSRAEDSTDLGPGARSRPSARK
jgi:hypothetical protein